MRTIDLGLRCWSYIYLCIAWSTRADSLCIACSARTDNCFGVVTTASTYYRWFNDVASASTYSSGSCSGSTNTSVNWWDQSSTSTAFTTAAYSKWNWISIRNHCIIALRISKNFNASYRSYSWVITQHYTKSTSSRFKLTRVNCHGTSSWIIRAIFNGRPG